MGVGGDNYGDELQVAWRLYDLTEAEEATRFRPIAADKPLLRMLLTNNSAGVYARMCAAYFLADTDGEARSLLTNYLASSNLRHRFNAARTIQWFASHAKGEPCQWASMQLVRMVENRSLELPAFRSYRPSPGDDPKEGDFLDDDTPPINYVVATLGRVKEPRAIPGLESLIQRNPGNYYGAVGALGEIGDPSVGPFLLDVLNCGNVSEVGAALGALKYQPAAHRLVSCLFSSGDSRTKTAILESLREIGDPSVVPEIEKYVHSLPQSDELPQRKAGERILRQLRAQDSLAVTLTMLENETDRDERIHLIRALGRYQDERARSKLFVLAVSSNDTLIRENAIGALAAAGDKSSLMTLVDLLESNSPAPTEFDKMAILAGHPRDYTRWETAVALRRATREDFGTNAGQWRSWLERNTR